MAINDTFDKLRSLQEILSKKIILESEIQEIPKILANQEDVLVHYKKTYLDQNRRHVEIQTKEKEYQNTLLDIEKAREEAEKKVEFLSTTRELEAIEREIKTLQDKEQRYRKLLQDEGRNLVDILREMGQMDAIIKQQENDLNSRKISIEQDINEKKRTVAELVEQEKQITPDLDPETLFKFERIIKNKEGKGIVALRGGVCNGCHMVLPIQFANDVRQGKDIVFCPYCSRILFYEESDQMEENFFDNDDAGSLSDLDDLDEEDEEDEEDINIDYED
ncbi:MAG: C4-type zinc ribbon domain-containing protein [Treponema sp.]|jgi:predicted  nucleic acid-binding Zn-ribbon protein|nr:C4-type zinc ribbon domain-containing protein [Treponema sp.]